MCAKIWATANSANCEHSHLPADVEDPLVFWEEHGGGSRVSDVFRGTNNFESASFGQLKVDKSNLLKSAWETENDVRGSCELITK